MLTAVILSTLFAGFQPEPPDTLTLEYCYSRVENHYPLARKIELQNEITDLNKKIANTAYYPQLNFGAQATYQSEVTELSGGQLAAPELSKDQYKATLDVSQQIYNGGAVGLRTELEEMRGSSEKNAFRVELHKIKDQVNQVYFGILLAQQQLQITGSLMKNLKAQIQEVATKVEHGVLLPSQKHILEAELIKAKQDSSEIQSNIKSGYEVLSQLISEEVNPEIKLKTPQPEISLQVDIPRQRPEFDLFESNRRTFDYQKDLARTNMFPSLSAFGTAAYGRPGFNVFEDDLHAYYIVGLRLQWDFWSAQNAGKQQQIFQLRQKSITEEERAFERQLNANLSKIREQIELLEDKLKRDSEIINLREKVVEEKSSQVKNGTATATEYVTELNKATQARLSMMLHKIRLVQSKMEYQITAGLTEN